MSETSSNQYKIYACNFLKGILWNCVENHKLDLAVKFIENHQELMEDFEKSGVLNYSIKTNEHTKNIVIPFLELGYNLNNDISSVFSAIDNRHFKTTKMLIQNGFDPNYAINGETIVEKCFSLINVKSSNTTIKKSLSILQIFPYDSLSDKVFDDLENAILKSEKTLQFLNKQSLSLCENYFESILQIKDRYLAEKSYRELNKVIINKDQNITKVLKI